MADQLVLFWMRGKTLVVQGHVARGTVQARKVAELAWPTMNDDRTPASEWAGWLKSELKNAAIDASQATLVLPRGECVARRLELPNAPDDDLPDLVRMQAATVSSTPVERILLDFVPLPTLPDSTGRQVLLASVFKERVDFLSRVLMLSGIELSSVTLSSTALAEAVEKLHQQSAGTAQTYVGIVPNAADADLVVLHNKQLVIAQALDVSAAEWTGPISRVAAEIGRVLVPLENLIGNSQIDQLFVAGLPLDAQSQLADRLRCSVSSIDLSNDGGLIQAPDQIGPLSSSVATAAGAFLLHGSPQVAGIDFLNPRKPTVRKDYTKHRWAAAAVAVVLLVGGVYTKLRMDESALDDQIAEIQKRDAEASDFNKRNEATLGKAADMAAWSARKMDWLAQIQAIGAQLPGTSELFLTDFRAVPSTGDASGRIRVTGYARERRQVETVAQRLAAAKFRVRPPEIRFSPRDAGYQYRFEIDVDVLLAAATPTKPAK